MNVLSIRRKILSSFAVLTSIVFAGSAFASVTVNSVGIGGDIYPGGSVNIIVGAVIDGPTPDWQSTYIEFLDAENANTPVPGTGQCFEEPGLTGVSPLPFSTSQTFVMDLPATPLTATYNYTITIYESNSGGPCGANGGGTDAPGDPVYSNIWGGISVAPLVDIAMSASDTPDPVTAGSGAMNLVHVLTANNNGPNDATGVSVAVTQVFPVGVSIDSVVADIGSWDGGTLTWTIGDHPVGVTANLTITLTADSSIAAGTDVISATGTATSIETDSDLTNNTAVNPTSVIRISDLIITKSDDPDSVVAGEFLTYTLISTNNGPSNADNHMISDSTPADTTFVSVTPSVGGVCATPAVGATGSVDCIWLESDPSQSFSVEIVVLVAASAAPDSPIINVATTKSDSTDPNTDDNSADESTTVVDVADMSISKLDNIDPVQGGGNSVLIYTVSVYNAGPSDARNVSVFDDLPREVTFESTDGCSNDPTGVPNCDLGYIASGQGAEYTIVVRPQRSDSLITNTVTVSTSAFDPEDDNNTASQQTQLDAVAIPVNSPLFLTLLLLFLSASGWWALRRN